MRLSFLGAFDLPQQRGAQFPGRRDPRVEEHPAGARLYPHRWHVGFLNSVGLQVGITMLGDMLGVMVHAQRTLARVCEISQSLPQINLPTLAFSVLAAGGSLLGNHVAPRLAFSLFPAIGTIAASAAFHFADRDIAVIGPVPGELPSIGVPKVTWSETLALLPVAASCFAMIITQSAATSRIFALRHRERVDANADNLGRSAANAAAAIGGAFVVNGSPTQSATAEGAGARSQLAQLVFGTGARTRASGCGPSPSSRPLRTSCAPSFTTVRPSFNLKLGRSGWARNPPNRLN